MPSNDILFKYQPTGASAATASQDGLGAGGVKASQQMAKTDLSRLQKYKLDFLAVAEKLDLPPALLAAIASRETRGGSGLVNGYGDAGNGFGLMQVDKRFHKLSGGPFSREHIEQASGILKTSFLAVQQKHATWPLEQQLRGAVAAYNSGVSNVQTQKGMDKGTTGGDYSNDTWARAQYLAPHFGGAKSGSVSTSPTTTPTTPPPKEPTPPKTSTQGNGHGTQPGQQQAQGSAVVRELQLLLVKYGYMTEQQVQTGPGILGPKTQAAMARFLADKASGASSSNPTTGNAVTPLPPKTSSTTTPPKTTTTTPPKTSSTTPPPKTSTTTTVAALDPRQKLVAVHPVLAGRVNAMAAALAKRKIPIRITDGLRTFAEQDALYAIGRTTQLDRGIVTKARGGKSNHNYGLAVDVVPLVNGQPNWNVSQAIWDAIGEEGVRAGLEWGGTWKELIDLPHFQLPVGLSVDSCLSIYKKSGISGVWAEADKRLRKAA